MRQTIRRLLKFFATSNPVVTGFAALAAVGTLATAAVMIAGVPALAAQGRWSDPAVLVEIVGIVCLFLVGARSLSRALLDLFFKERRIAAGIGVHDSWYKFQSLFDAKTREILITGSTLRNALDNNLGQHIQSALRGNPDVRITLICAPYEMLKIVSARGAADLVNSVRAFDHLVTQLSAQESDRLSIYFHPGALSLSCMVRDPERKWRAVAVFTPRWGTDTNPGRRPYCVLEKWEERELFETVYRGIDYPESERISLNKMIDDLVALNVYKRSASGLGA